MKTVSPVEVKKSKRNVKASPVKVATPKRGKTTKAAPVEKGINLQLSKFCSYCLRFKI